MNYYTASTDFLVSTIVIDDRITRVIPNLDSERIRFFVIGPEGKAKGYPEVLSGSKCPAT